MPAFNRWYHCMSNTFGTWLPGDPRGFRTRKHREHVEGDYKSPPPKGKYDQRHEFAKNSTSREAVILAPDARKIACEAIRVALIDFHKIEAIAIAVSGMHLHLLARFPSAQEPTDEIRGLRASDPVRHFVGIAKKESAKSLTNAGLVKPGGVWAKRGKIVPIKDRRHQVNVFNYILDHEQEGAAVWSFRDAT